MTLPAKPRNGLADRVKRAAHRLEERGQIEPRRRGAEPGTIRADRPGYSKWRVRQIVDGKRRTRAEAAATFAHQPWAKRAEEAGASAGYYVWEIPEEVM